jgi:hypothetical protein
MSRDDEDVIMATMVERAVEVALEESGRADPSILLLADGPYGIPRAREPDADEIAEEA